jgi:hypothetical protein
MPPQTHEDQAHPQRPHFDREEAQPRDERDEQVPPPAAPRPPLSRRSVLRGAAGAGALGLAAAAGAGAAVAATRPPAPALPPASKPVAVAAVPPAATAGPLVVYIADSATGQFDIFAGTGQVRVSNPALVGQLLANLKLA